MVLVNLSALVPGRTYLVVVVHAKNAVVSSRSVDWQDGQDEAKKRRKHDKEWTAATTGLRRDGVTTLAFWW